MMPIGPYTDFAACVADQKKKGYSDDVSSKICGKIEANSRKEIMAAATADSIHKKRKDVASMSMEDDLRFLKTGIASRELRILEIEYEKEHGHRLPYAEDEHYNWLFEHKMIDETKE